MVLPDEIEDVLIDGGYEPIGIDSLEDLGAIKTLTFDDNSGHRVKSIGIHDDFLILPKKLYLRQNILNVTENISDKLNAEVRFALTNDLKHYYVYLNGEFVMIKDFARGMPLSKLNEVDFSHWQGNIGVAVYIAEMKRDKEIEIKDLFIIANNKYNIIANGDYKISFSTLVDVAMGEISIVSNDDIDAMFL